MDKKIAEEVIQCLPTQRTLFHYGKDRYAYFLLQSALAGKRSALLSELKKTPYGKLLNKPSVQQTLRHCGDGRLRQHALQEHWNLAQQSLETYRLSLGVWGSESKSDYAWQQTSRSGVNLVLQLNFNGAHDAEFESWTGLERAQALNYLGHPVSERDRNTLAWARLDIDFDSNTVLVEEIQTDWVRRAHYVARQVKRFTAEHKEVDVWGMRVNRSGFLSYLKNVMDRHSAIWSEAVLTAALWFIREELGIKTVYYHSVESGALLKNMDDSLPPVSTYKDVPRKFCFSETQTPPAFLMNDTRARRRLKKRKAINWYYMEV